MSDLSAAILAAADALPYWRDGVIAALAGVVIAALWLYASLVGVE